MQLKSLVLVAATTLTAAIAQLAAIPQANAQRPPANVSCEPFRVHGNIYHQRCVRTLYDAAGNVIGTSVYYIDENGVPYMLAE